MRNSCQKLTSVWSATSRSNNLFKRILPSHVGSSCSHCWMGSMLHSGQTLQVQWNLELPFQHVRLHFYPFSSAKDRAGKSLFTLVNKIFAFPFAWRAICWGWAGLVLKDFAGKARQGGVLLRAVPHLKMYRHCPESLVRYPPEPLRTYGP